MIPLQNQVVIVTGASRGIGRAIALLFAQQGARVVLAARNKRELEKVARQIGLPKGQALVIPCDVTRENQVKNLIKKTLQKYRRIDILINNAGLGIHKPIIEFTSQDWDITLDTNLKGPFLCTREVLPVMIKQKSGQIINIGSLAGKNPIANLAAYCASKFGLIGFSESVGLEVRNHNIKLNLLLPGTVDTFFGKRKPRAKPGQHPENALTAEEVAEACLFLATQEPLAWTSQMNIRPLIVRR
jgi:NAD(P)-dependent dehydrogenase (short-subunit alcohol dehydrogenase family)